MAAPVTGRRVGYWHPLWLLARRDLLVRYSTSVLGYLWSLIDPLVMSAIYFFVFTVVFQKDTGSEPYIVFLLAGLLPWVWFNGTVSDTTRAYWKEGRLVRSVKIPGTVWVNQLVLAKGIEFIASIPVIVVFAMIAGATVHWQAVFVIPAILLQAALTVGVGLIVAPAVVFFRDLERVTKLVLRFLFYASPIVYSVQDLPHDWQWIAEWNPLASIFTLYRGAFFPELLSWEIVLPGVVVTAALVGIGYLVHRATRRAVLKEI